MSQQKRWSATLYGLLESVGVVGYSGKKNLYGLHPLIISSLVIIFTLAVVDLLRKFVNVAFKEGIIKVLAFEFIATAELCACCFELIIVADNYGVFAYAVFLFLLTLWWSKVWEDATACPYVPVEEVVEGIRDIKTALMVVFAQVLGGLVVYKYIQHIWSMELAQTHIGRANEDCTADLAVHVCHGTMIEGLGTFLCRVFSRFLGEIDLRYGYVADSFFATTLVVAAFNYTGGYYNPALATSLKFGCSGNTFAEHMAVYWFGATLGAVLAFYFFKLPAVQEKLEKFRKQKQA